MVNQLLSVGKDQQETIGKNRSTDIGKNDRLKIVLRTGDSSIIMKSDGTITIEDKNIVMKGSNILQN